MDVRSSTNIYVYFYLQNKRFDDRLLFDYGLQLCSYTWPFPPIDNLNLVSMLPLDMLENAIISYLLSSNINKTNPLLIDQ